MLRSPGVRQIRRLSNQSMIRFLDGNAMPVIGYGCSSKASQKRNGVQERFETALGEVERGVRAALQAGYRCLDTAQCYENEEEVGAAIAAKVADGTVQRNEIFVTTKVFQTFNRRCDVMAAAKASLAKLRLDHVDLLLVHSSCATQRLPDSIWAQTREDGSWIPDDRVGIQDTWKGMEDVRKAGLARSIGVSNFNEAQLQTLWDHAELKPQCLQTEQHIYFPQQGLLAFCEEKGIAVTGYATLGSPGRLKHQWSEGAYQVDPGNLMEEPKVLAIAQRTGNTPAQILLRWSLQHGLCVIPKSNDPARMRQNFEVNFELSSEDMESLDNCATRQRLFFNEWDYDHPDYPWKEEWRAERSKVAKE